MFRHQVSQHASLNDFYSYPQEIEAPGVPQNLTCESDSINKQSFIKWEKPTSGGAVFYYELFVNDSFHANVSNTNFTYSNANDGDTFKVRAVGVLGLKSGFSNTCSYSGDVALNPSVTGIADKSSLHLHWRDISNSDQVTVEGYNVYVDGVKQNSSLLALNVFEYPNFNLSVGTNYDVGVSFEYDGGQESAIFDVTAAPPSGGVRYYAMTKSFYNGVILASNNVLPGEFAGDPQGLHVEEGTEIHLQPEFSPENQHDEVEWSSPSRFTYDFRFQPLGTAVMSFLEGCGNGLTLEDDPLESEKVILSTNEDGNSIVIGLNKSYNFRFIGPACNDPRKIKLSATISLSEGDIIDEAWLVEDNRKFFKLPSDGKLLKVNDGDSLYWVTFPGTPLYDIYIRSKGVSSFPTDPHNSSPVDSTANMYDVSSLAADTYEARVDYMLRDETLMLQSNIAEFTIS